MKQFLPFIRNGSPAQLRMLPYSFGKIWRSGWANRRSCTKSKSTRPTKIASYTVAKWSEIDRAACVVHQITSYPLIPTRGTLVQRAAEALTCAIESLNSFREPAENGREERWKPFHFSRNLILINWIDISNKLYFFVALMCRKSLAYFCSMTTFPSYK